MARIAIGGFQHETNTFAPAKATYGDFEMADGWPGLTRGGAVLEEIRGMNLPLAGFVERASARGHDRQPVVLAAPSGPVEEEAYERIAGTVGG
jgi:microcystin degradation protein MlrC